MKKNSVDVKYNKKICLILSMLLVVSIVVFSGCSKKQETVATNKITSESSEEKKNENTKNEEIKKDEQKEEEKKETQKAQTEEKKEQASNISFGKHEMDKEPDFATEWKKSSNGKMSACIDGKGSKGIEEGIANVCIKNIENNKKWYFNVTKSDKKVTPKLNIEWIDDENIAVIVGEPYGTVAVGGNVYKLNIVTGKNTIIYDTKDLKKQVTSVKKVNDELKLEILVYEDDQLQDKHTENKTINLGENK